MSEKIELLKSLGFSDEFIHLIEKGEQYQNPIDSFTSLPSALVFDSLDSHDICVTQEKTNGVTDKMNFEFK